MTTTTTTPMQEQQQRYCLFPIEHLDIWEAYKKHKQAFWTVEEIDFTIDRSDWETRLTSQERYFIESILAFFAGSDGIVLENLVQNFCSEIKIPEARCFYAFQAMMENIHSEAYSLMIDTFVKDPARKKELFEAIDKIPCVKKKADWAIRWISAKEDLLTRMFAFGIVEGLFFSGAFCAIFWLKERNLMVNSLGKSNEWIARDESLHTDFAVLMHRILQESYGYVPIPEEKIIEIMKEAVDIETEFVCESLPVRLIGMNQDSMTKYIRFVADRLLVQFGYRKIFHVTNPFPFMEKIGLDGKTNFFEQRVSEYNRSMVFSTTKKEGEGKDRWAQLSLSSSSSTPSSETTGTGLFHNLDQEIF
jgi:ribonucleoside-diphosphate reductase subunit M2